MFMIHCGGGDSWDESIEMGMWSIADFLGDCRKSHIKHAIS